MKATTQKEVFSKSISPQSRNMQRLSNLSSLQIFQLFRYGTFILIGIGFAKLGISLTQIGLFETFILLSGLLSFFWTSAIINTLLSVYNKQTTEQQKVLLFNTFLMLVVLSIGGAVLLSIFSTHILLFLNKSNSYNIIVATALYLLLNTTSFINEYVLYLKEENRTLLLYAFITSMATALAALLPVVLGFDIEYSLYALVTVSVAKLCFTCYLLVQYCTFTFSRKIWVSNFHLAFPLMLSFLLSGSAEYIDGIIVKWKFDDMFFAIYRYGAKELPIMLIVSNTLSTALLPAISADLHSGVKELKEKSLQLMHWLFPLTILLLLTSPWIYKWAFSESFTYSALIFNIYLLLIIPRMLFPQTILTARGQTKFILISSILELAINVSLSIFLAQKIGLYGVAIGTVVAYTFDKLFLISVNFYINRISPSLYVYQFPFAAYTTATLTAFVIGFWIMQKF